MVFLLLGKFIGLFFVLLLACFRFSGQIFAELCMHSIQVALPVVFRASIDLVYGGRCHGSGYIVHSTVVPNVRCAFTIGHMYLDLVESPGEIPIQFTVDGGTEPQCMFQLHEQLRSDNIPIEALWSYFLKNTGHDLNGVAILLGKT
ncbi:hypothetical protein B0H19DRAFT_1072057 [Mycena capillaripes]|nr:hypothetical protein B0H19DRAFT_1072057 [Mycena capillaripes]